jgi:para-nitrobenzyl esterase
MNLRAVATAWVFAVLFLGSASAGIRAGEMLNSASPVAVAPATDALPPEILDVTWQWIWFGSGAEQFDVGVPERYTLQFFADGTVAVLINCNRGRGQYSVGEDQRISLEMLATTLMACPEDPLESRFMTTLERVATYFQMDDDFFLEVPADSGTLRFRRAPQDQTQSPSAP